MFKNKNNILVIGDTQFPWEHPEYLAFCKKLCKKFKCGRVIHIGDFIDATNWSDYTKDPDVPGITSELYQVRQSFKAWQRAFPKVECIIGNHERRLIRRLNAAGFGESLITLRDVLDIVKFPKDWSLHEQLQVQTRTGEFVFAHGDEVGSVVTPGSTARKYGKSVVRGHFHTRSYVHAYSARTNPFIAYDVVVGCGIDDKAVGFRYNRKDIARPILSAAVVLDGVPYVVPMFINKKGKWDGKV